jgi:cyclopropane fatty-acyl-phospholipid synthase-like methyltransferase
MSPRHTSSEWNQRYLDGNLPWDSGKVDPHLTAIIEQLALPDQSAVLEIGCGTGTNALWLAQRGYRVTAIDVAEKAIAMTRDKVKAYGGPDVTFDTADILDGLTGNYDFAFDRGCFHSVTDDERPIFAANLAAALKPGAWWLSLCGSADEQRAKGETGPPQLTAAHIAATVEPHFAIHQLDRIRFRPDGPTHMAWLCLSRKRG